MLQIFFHVCICCLKRFFKKCKVWCKLRSFVLKIFGFMQICLFWQINKVEPKGFSKTYQMFLSNGCKVIEIVSTYIHLKK